MNVRHVQPDSRDRVKPYGQALDVQNEILLKMTNVISDLRVKGKTFLLPFQKSKDFLL